MQTSIYPVTRDTVAAAAAGALARDLSLLFPAAREAPDAARSLIAALVELRELTAQERQEGSATLLHGRYLALREELLNRVLADVAEANQAGRLNALLAAHRPYLVNLVAGRTVGLPAGVPRQPSGDEGWLAQDASQVHGPFELRRNDAGHFLALVRSAAA